MGFLERAIKKGISDGIGKAVGNAITQAVQPKVNEMADKTADYLNRTAQNNTSTVNTASLEGAFGNLERAAQNFATQQAKNLKICPACEKPVSSELKFCPSCGEKLPETTVAEASVCPSCGVQNSIGTKFCVECGTKLPSAIMEEESNARKNNSVLEEWTVKLPRYPVWNGDGFNFYIDEYDGYFVFGADFKGNSLAARSAMEKYRNLVKQNGFRPAGQYPSEDHLYKMIDSVCYHIDFEHSFESGGDNVSLGFMTGEPSGGFNYVKPEPKKPGSLRDLFNF